MMEILNNIDTYPKILVAVTGLLAAYSKIKESFSQIRHKQELKLDLEIYEFLKKDSNINFEGINEKIEEKLRLSFSENKKTITSIITGFILFVGFGFWTFDIFLNSPSFNGWIILTSFLSILGFLSMFETNGVTIRDEAFYKIGIYNKGIVKMALIFIVVDIIASIFILKTIGLSYLLFITGTGFLIGILGLTNNIKRLK